MGNKIPDLKLDVEQKRKEPVVRGGKTHDHTRVRRRPMSHVKISTRTVNRTSCPVFFFLVYFPGIPEPTLFLPSWTG